jgi:hypothetical protein
VKRTAIDSWVRAALEYVPRGDACQNDFRMVLNMSLRNALGPRAEHPDWTVAQLVQHKLDILGCRPTFDRALLDLTWPPDRAARPA